jgi:hypothetical protein
MRQPGAAEREDAARRSVGADAPQLGEGPGVEDDDLGRAPGKGDSA